MKKLVMALLCLFAANTMVEAASLFVSQGIIQLCNCGGHRPRR